MTSTPPLTFCLGMASVEGSPPYPVIVFDDGAAVSLHSVRALALDLGLPLYQSSIDDLLLDWDRNFDALARLTEALAFDDRARGHRGHFVPSEILTAERLVPDARQIIRLDPSGDVVLPSTVQSAAAATLPLDKEMQKARPNFCFAAVLGRMCRNVDQAGAESAIAGWTLATELVRIDREGLSRRSGPGSLVLGPYLVPAAFAGKLTSVPYRLALMGRTTAEGTLDQYVQTIAAGIERISRDALLLPGDLVVAGEATPAPEMLEAGSVDVMEAYAPGFGRQKTSFQ